MNEVTKDKLREVMDRVGSVVSSLGPDYGLHLSVRPGAIVDGVGRFSVVVSALDDAGNPLDREAQNFRDNPPSPLEAKHLGYSFFWNETLWVVAGRGIRSGAACVICREVGGVDAVRFTAEQVRALLKTP